MRHKLEWQAHPRLQMTFLVALTGAMGLFASFVLLRAGVAAMASRYPLSVAFAYGAFLLLLWLWLRTQARDYLDATDLLSLGDSPGSTSAGTDINVFKGAGGRSGGAGASGSFDDGGVSAASVPDGVGEALGAADEGAVPILLVILVAAAVCALALCSIYVVYIAPQLFAELLVDGALSVSLYRRLNRFEPQHWLQGAIRNTLLPFLITAALLGVVGFLLQQRAPEARTLSEALTYKAR